MTCTASPGVKRCQGEARVTASAPPPRPIAVTLLNQELGDHRRVPDPVRPQQISTLSQPRGAPHFAVLNMCEQYAQWIECYRINGMDRIISRLCEQRKNWETFATSSCSNTWPSATLNQRAVGDGVQHVVAHHLKGSIIAVILMGENPETACKNPLLIRTIRDFMPASRHPFNCSRWRVDLLRRPSWITGLITGLTTCSLSGRRSTGGGRR